MIIAAMFRRLAAVNISAAVMWLGVRGLDEIAALMVTGGSSGGSGGSGGSSGG